jgi:hypothetical protein
MVGDSGAILPVNKAAVKRPPGAGKLRKWGAVALGLGVGGLLLAGLVGLWAAGVFRVQSKDGLLVVQVSEPTARLESAAGGMGFVPLFNGQDLSGWFVEGGDPKSWDVANGEIIAWGKDWATRNYLLTEKAYADYRLRLEFNLAKGANSGIGVRALREEKMPLNGQAVDEHPVFKLIETPGSDMTGTSHWVLNTVHAAPSQSAEMKPAGAWNHLELEVKGRSLRAWVNDREVANATLAAGSLLADGSLPGLNRSRGRIGLQKMNGTVRFRNIAIKELPAVAGAAASADKPGMSFPAVIPERDRAKWRIANGCLEETTLGHFVMMVFGESTWSDYDYSVDFLRVNGNDQCGLFFLLDADKKEGCLYGLCTFGNRAHTIEWWAKAKPKPGLVKRKASLPNGAWHTARVSVRGGRAQAFLGKQKILECKIDSHSTGRVGLRTYGSTFRFRNIKVTDPQGNVLLEGLPDLDSAWSAGRPRAPGA